MLSTWRKSEVGTSPLPSRGPKCGQNGYITRVPSACFWGGADSKCSRVLKTALGNWATQVHDTMDP